MMNDDERERSEALPPRSAASSDAVEGAIARALDAATREGRWDVVAQLAKELEARRLARDAKVIPLDSRTRARRG